MTSGKMTKPTRRMTKRDLRRQELIVLATGDSIMNRSRVIDALEALSRMDVGTYGTCIDCSDRISATRLDARPEALRCIECQHLHDQYIAA